MDEVVQEDPFREGLALARSMRDAWPWFVFAACCLFLGDVMVRRVAFNFDWVGRWLKRSEREIDQTPARLQALKQSKEAIHESLDRRRAAVRFEPTPEQATAEPAAELQTGTSPTKPKTAAKAASLAPDEAPKTYTERLLEAKRRARGNGDK